MPVDLPVELPVQQTAPTTTPDVRLPEQRVPDADAPAPAPAVPQVHGWGSEEDRIMGRWLLVMAVVLGLYSALFVVLGDRVFG